MVLLALLTTHSSLPQNVCQGLWIATHDKSPLPELAMMVNRAHPALSRRLLLTILLRLKAFHLEDDFHLASVLAPPADEEIGTIFVAHALTLVGDGEVQVVVVVKSKW